jgi:hypothetical protein
MNKLFAALVVLVACLLSQTARAEIIVIKCMEAIGSLRYNFVIEPHNKYVLEPPGAGLAYIDKDTKGIQDEFSISLSGKGRYDALYEFKRSKKKMNQYLINKDDVSNSPRPVEYGCSFESIYFDPSEILTDPPASITK